MVRLLISPRCIFRGQRVIPVGKIDTPDWTTAARMNKVVKSQAPVHTCHPREEVDHQCECHRAHARNLYGRAAQLPQSPAVPSTSDFRRVGS